MLASQFIYTACGKDRTGAFSVWAKSADITKAESDEIAKVMIYKRPADLPYEPTQEEIDTLFPKKTGYFLLSSGRYCVAQSTYIGRVYSDQDLRSGNYIIHAFVLDDVEDFQPMSFFGTDLFRTKLTYEEWHENAAPEDLPRIEVPTRMDSLNKNTIDTFFDDTRCQRLQWLLQSAINAYYGNDKVTFYDAEANLQYWYKAISLCLPLSMEKKLTFCSFFTPLPPVASQNSAVGAEEVKLRNVAPTVLASLFSYAQEVRGGKFAFDFANNVVNENVPVSRYVKSVVSLLKKNLFEALMMVDAVDKLMVQCGCSLDEAADLYSLRKGDFDWFVDLAELLSVVEKARRLIPEAIPEIADGLYSYCVIQDRWPCSSQILPLYRLVFDFSEKANKGQIVEKYLYNHTDFGVDDRLDSEAFARAMMDTAPFLWVNFVDYIFESDNMNRFLSANRENFNAWYLVYVSLVDALKNLSENQKKFAHDFFLKLMGKAIQTQSSQQFDVLLDGIRKLGTKWETWLIQNSLAALMVGGKKLTEVCDTNFLLNLVARLSSQDVALLILKELALENTEDHGFIESYVNKTETSRDLFERYEAELKTDAACARFLENVEMQRFTLKSKLTRSDLNKYYKQFYATGKDNGLLLKKLGSYLSTISDNGLVSECQDLYDEWFAKLPDDHPRLLDCVAKLADTVYDLQFTLLLKNTEKTGQFPCEDMIDRLAQAGHALPEQYDVLKLGLEIRSASGKGSARKHNERNRTLEQLEDKVFFHPLKSPAMVDLFVENFLTDLLMLYMTRSEKTEFETVMEECFEPLADSRKFAKGMCLLLDKLDKKNYETFLTDLFCYAFGQKTHLAGRLARVVNGYLDASNRGKRKKIFDMVERRVPKGYDKEVFAFITKYEKEHESFFGRLFGGSKKDAAKEKADKSKKDKHKDEEEDEEENQEDEMPEEPREPEQETKGGINDGKRKWKK